MRKTNRAGNKRTREVGIRRTSIERILIVSEGENTEIAYFNSIKANIQERYQANLIVDKVDIESKGIGRGTMAVVNYALKSRNRHTYSDVWVVIDKDDFPDFDEAIREAEKQGLSVAWSNSSFELWFLLHFQHVSSGLDNKQLVHKLTSHLNEKGIIQTNYTKSDKILYSDLNEGIQQAMQRSEKLLETHKEHSITQPSRMNPGTTVYKLLDKLLPYLE